MQWLVRVDNTARVTALQEGTAIAGENIPFSNIDQLVGAGVTVDSVDSYGIGFLMFNCQKEPFNDKRVPSGLPLRHRLRQADQEPAGRQR